MTPANLPPDVEAMIKNAFTGENAPDGWDQLAVVGHRLRRLDPSFSPQKYGFLKFVELLKALPHLVELKRDDSIHPPVYFGRLLLGAPLRQPAAAAPTAHVTHMRPSRLGDIPFWNYAYIPTRSDTLRDLAETALSEKWYFGSEPPDGFQHPILDNYLTYTFLRLQHENKVLIASGNKYSAFNIGLVDKRFEPIYALLAPDREGRPQPWFLWAFCIAGEGRVGKELVSHFNPLPEPPHYFSNPLDMFYDVRAGEPKVDWKHIIKDNVDRMPIEFIQENCPKGFEPLNPRELSEDELDGYRKTFSDALDNDARAYRDIIRRLGDGLDVALRRTRWNFKTAIPMYYPRKRSVSLLLPLGLLTDESIDVALVVERTQVGNYLGHTILPLDWAYNNARLVASPDSDWLTPSLIHVSPSIPTDITD